MDQRFKTPIIAGSIIAVLIGLIVVGVLAYRARRLATLPVEPPGQTGGPATGTPQGGSQFPPSGTNPPSSSGTGTGLVTEVPAQNGVTGVSNPTPDHSVGPDRDKDGLSDSAETAYGTNPDKSDTDDDGFNDRDEAIIYGSDPLNKAETPATMPGHEKFNL